MQSNEPLLNGTFCPKPRTESGTRATLLLRLFLVLVLLFMFVTVRPMQAQNYQVLHQFSRAGSDGAVPYAGMTLDRAGNFYGTTVWGGYSGGYGTVYRLAKLGSNWVFTSLYSFTGGTDGAMPESPVTIGPDGALYGTASIAGGQGNCQYQDQPPGCGTVYRLRPPAHISPTTLPAWTETTIHAFSGTGDGAYPHAGVVFDAAGNLYGATGANDQYLLNGVIYELTPHQGSWQETTLYTFQGGSDGSDPYSSLIFDNAGALYGTTPGGGADNGGTVYQLTPSANGWTEKILYSFYSDGSGGSMPFGGLIFDQHGNLFGTTDVGRPAPTVFELSPGQGGWTFNVMSTLVSGSAAALVMDAAGNFYGTTIGGGAYPCNGGGCGTIFRLTPSPGGWIYTTLHDFTGDDGEWPMGPPVFNNGKLYGTTQSGGAYRYGVIWELTP